MEQQKTITTLFLDIGGVLLTNGWDRAARKLAASTFDLDLAELEERHHLTFDTYEEGKLTLDEYLNRIVFYEPRPFTKETFTDFIYAQSAPYPDMLELIPRLKEKYKLKIVFVNNEGRELNQYRISRFGINKFADAFVSSCFVHFRKPDADIFRVAIDIAQVSPEQVLYIDDRPMFVSVAESLGLNGHRHTTYEDTVVKLASYGLTF